jgi:hypothetical protein
MDNFDLKKYLVENKVTTNSQLEEAANIKDIMSKLQAGDFAALAKMPADQKLAQTILNTLKQSQPELLKKLAAYAKKNEKMLAEGVIKNTLIGLLMAGVLGLGFSSAVDSSSKSQAAAQKASTEQSSDLSDISMAQFMLGWYKDHKQQIDTLAKNDPKVGSFAITMNSLDKETKGGTSGDAKVYSQYGSQSDRQSYEYAKSQVDSMTTARYK